MTNSNVQKMHTTKRMRCIGCGKKIPDTSTTGCSPIVNKHLIWLRAEIYDCGLPACKSTRLLAAENIELTFDSLRSYIFRQNLADWYKEAQAVEAAKDVK